MNTEIKEEMTVDVTPAWEITMRVLAESIFSRAPERNKTAIDEIIRGGQILDQLIAERNLTRVINHADDSNDIIEKRVALRKQMRAVNNTGVELECFDCKRKVRLMYMYKCRDCGLYFCPSCATKHFEPKDLLSLLWAVAAQGERGPMQKGVFEIVHGIFERRGLSVNDLCVWKEAQEG
ncbi:hypothetical protein [Desulfovibrio sp. JC010]|uniref:hypothetical protein n=1 Tax=Desulfovibrio sp. JC010 TaxID=2593641 RepID=UPI0013D3C32A|nr:hypothetical protein [Desulfovibrio sp. JC010]NDV27739.1 hypothetical protein [Desulfovibrio sp. JC010]